MTHGRADGASPRAALPPHARPIAVLVGADSLLCQCGESLLARGVEIAAVVTGTARVRAWAEQHGVRAIDLASDWMAELESGDGFDWLFAITHLRLLPDRALALPRRGAINFHDAPLPDLAGLYCPVWALLEGRTEYGVTWHFVTKGIDEGDIVAERRFAVSENETSLSLNTKCFEAGLAAFDELADRMVRGELVGRPQGSGPRRLCRGDERPEAACALDFKLGADELERIVRALDFGRYPNPFGTPWFAVGGRPVWVTAATAVDGPVGASAGLVLDVDESGAALVACGEGALRLTGLRAVCGRSLDAEAAGLTGGARIDELDAALAARLGEVHARIAKAEGAWAEEFAALMPADTSYAAPGGTGAVGSGSATFELPHTFTSAFGDGPAAVAALVGAFLARTSQQTSCHVAWRGAVQRELAHDLAAFVSDAVPLGVDLSSVRTFAELVAQSEQAIARADRRGTFLADLVARHPALAGAPAGRFQLPIAVVSDGASPYPGTRANFVQSAEGWSLAYERAALSDASAQSFAYALADFATVLADSREVELARLPLVGAASRQRYVDTHYAFDHDRSATVASQFTDAVRTYPDEPALSSEGATLSYRDLDARVSALASRLVAAGAQRETLVGVHLERGIDLVVAVLAVHRTGAAYLPLDPDYPSDRLDLMLADSGAPLVVTLGWRGAMPANCRAFAPTGAAPAGDVTFEEAAPEDLAYCIYTSGSTGTPKGVLVEHRNAVNFFAGMDERIGCERGTWLAVTSLSFDISVLELIWTLTRGWHVVVYRERQRDRSLATTSARATSRELDFSVFLWGNDDGVGPDKYALTMGAAEFADRNGFAAIWTPERHFHAFGGPFPNPSVISAAIAARTSNIAIRAGSCVVPLHHPLRIAEEWAVVDHLSNGRVGIAAASGWQPDDFVLAPENFADRSELMFTFVDQVRRLWRGEHVEFANPFGEQVPYLSLPRPVQSELPLWITTAGNPDTYRRAGEIGANLLTHLLGQSVAEVADKIAIYREARAKAGYDPATGIVTMMLHTFVGSDSAEVRDTVRGPLKSYLDASIGLVKKYAWSFPAFKQTSGSKDVDLSSLTDEERGAVLEHAFDRYFTTSGLFGTPASCVERVAELEAIGVDEIACLVDYGVERATMLASLELLGEVFRRTRVAAPATSAGVPSSDAELWTIQRSVAHHGVTHLQCTPSMARMLLVDDESRSALGALKHVMVGGEALAADLARELAAVCGGRVTNMYGPTETTIWSSTWDVPQSFDDVSIGAPIANTSLYVLDASNEPVPEGVPGELWIGGEGVVRGYHARPELTAERFVSNPFASGRMYRTGDQASWNSDGSLRFLGRNDHQVKIRGYRIELGEIESKLREDDTIHDAVAIAREDTPGDVRLVAYVTATNSVAVRTDAVRQRLEAILPAHMVPSAIVVLETLPQTPNGKVDRKALPRPESQRARGPVATTPPASDLERNLAERFAVLLGLPSVGRDDNFFELGGHSLLVVQLHREIVADVAPKLSLTDLYRFPTVAGLAGFIGGAEGESADSGSTRGSARGAARRELLRRRRNAS